MSCTYRRGDRKCTEKAAVACNHGYPGASMCGFRFCLNHMYRSVNGPQQCIDCFQRDQEFPRGIMLALRHDEQCARQAIAALFILWLFLLFTIKWLK